MEQRNHQILKSLKREIDKSWQERDLRRWERLKTIFLYQQGYPPQDICTAVDVSRRSIFYWLERYKTFGVDGLAEKEHPGRPRGLGGGFGSFGRYSGQRSGSLWVSSGIWTCSQVGHIIQAEFGVSYPEDHVRKILRLLGFSGQRPTKKLAQADAQWQQKWVEDTFPALKKTTKKRGVLLFQDEAVFRLKSTLFQTWARVGHQPQILSMGQKKTQHVFGAVRIPDRHFLYRFTEVCNSITFRSFHGAPDDGPLSSVGFLDTR